VPEFPVYIPEPIRLQTLKVNDLRVTGPGGIVFEKVREEVQAIVCTDLDLVALPNGECVHDDLVGEMVNVIFYRAFEIVQIIRHFFRQQREAATLHGEDAGVDPVPLRRR